MGCLEMVDLRQGQWGISEDMRISNLERVKGLLSMDIGPSDGGWSIESARLFSIDAAMLALRRLWNSVGDKERQELSGSLQEARRMVVDRRDEELGFLQLSLESRLKDSRHRGVWLTTLNALMPCPFRAAEATLEAALQLEPHDQAESLASLLRRRLSARLDEGMLLLEADLSVTV